MTQKITKHEAKTPDALLARLQNMFRYSRQHSLLILGAFGALIAVTIVLGLIHFLHERSELSLQEKYFSFEKAYLDKKEKFEEVDQKLTKAEKEKNAPSSPPGTDKSKKEDKTKVGAKNDTADKAKEIEKLKIEKSTGDLEKDYGKIVSDLQGFIKENPKSKAAQMAALNLFEIFVKYNKPENSAEVYSSFAGSVTPKEIIGGLVINQYASILANRNECAKAIDLWKSIVSTATASVLHNEVRLRMGLCYEALGQNKSAEEMYTEVTKKVSSEKDSAGHKEAEKYLRLLKFKTGSGSPSGSPTTGG